MAPYYDQHNFNQLMGYPMMLPNSNYSTNMNGYEDLQNNLQTTHYTGSVNETDSNNV
jgi:hypothetical protein